MPRTLKLLPLMLSLAAPLCAHVAAHPVRQTPDATQQASTNDAESKRRQTDLAEARRLGEDLLSLYVSESRRAEEQYPMPSNSNEETRKPVFEKREVARAPLKARMRAAADRLDTLTESQPGDASQFVILEYNFNS